MKRILVIIRSAPFDSTSARDAIESALTAAVFGQAVSVLLMGDGVYSALRSQMVKGSGFKDTAAMLQSLPLYEVENIQICKESLFTRGLAIADCVIGAPANCADIKALFNENEVILTY
ncbi:Uncharacterized protein involved in the oxidation [gamma proteobacterium HdN1]|nr:Uncharacterized protein involved in the oxidation [gamma proteobacterium HdN1]